MKKLFAVLFALLLPAFAFIFISQPESHAGTQPRKRYVEGEILVKFRDSAGPAWAARRMAEESLASRYAAIEDLETYEAGEVGGLVLVKLAPGVSVEEGVAAAYADPRVEYAEPNYLVYPAVTPNDAFFNQQWGLSNNGAAGGKIGADIGATLAWDMTTGSDDIIVAVTDSGVDLAHQDLAANAWVNPLEIPGNGIDDDGNGFVDDINGWNFFSKNNQVSDDPFTDFHGTHVAGIIGARGNNGIGVTGVAWNVKIVALKFIGRAGGGDAAGSIADAVRAINYATALRKRGENLRVINASWGGPDPTKSLKKAIKKAGKAGILVVAAAGNGGDDGRGDDIDSQPDYPASWSSALNNLVSVAAIDRADRLPVFTNFGRKNVSVAAPGVTVFSTLPGNQYGTLNGTSMAAPHVAGIAVLLFTKEPNLTPAEVKQRLIDTAVPLLPLASKSVSAGRVNAFNALNNRIVAPDVGLTGVSATKKALTVEGLGFPNGATVIEADGVPLSGKLKVDASSKHASNTFRRVTIKLGKPTMNAVFPIGQQVQVTVFDPTTGQRSDPIPFTRQ